MLFRKSRAEFHLSTIQSRTEATASLIRSQFRTIASTAIPTGPVRMATSSGQLAFSQLTTFLAASISQLMAADAPFMTVPTTCPMILNAACMTAWTVLDSMAMSMSLVMSGMMSARIAPRMFGVIAVFRPRWAVVAVQSP